ncbi:MAG: hypothetical protein M1395_06505 [Bacteroidetes bacterium]|nr:hypothetical protein [Bacteroidota bacterium]
MCYKNLNREDLPEPYGKITDLSCSPWLVSLDPMVIRSRPTSVTDVALLDSPMVRRME